MDMTPLERKLVIEALDIAEAHHQDAYHLASRDAVRNLRSRLASDPHLVISYRHDSAA